MKTGNVSVFTQPNVPLEFREYPVPSVADDDLLVKIRMANICGSDLHIWRGHGSKIPQGIPQVLGHEMVGNIEQLGKNVKVDSTGERLEEGDRIAYSYFKPCNQCWMCLSGKPGMSRALSRLDRRIKRSTSTLSRRLWGLLLHEAWTLDFQSSGGTSRCFGVTGQLRFVASHLRTKPDRNYAW